MLNKKISIKELLIGSVIGWVTYFLIAVINISNEDIYNMDLRLIIDEGDWLNITGLFMFWLWLFILLTWLLSLIIRIARSLF